MPVEYEYDSVPAERAPVRKKDDSSGLAEVISVILDKGIVIDAWVSVSVLGLEILTIQARVVVASVETYLRYAEAIGLAATAAPPPWQQVVPGRRKEQEAGGPSEDEMLRNLSEHPEGLQLEAMQARLDAPRERLDEILSHLVAERKVHRDKEHNLYLPEGQRAIGCRDKGEQESRRYIEVLRAAFLVRHANADTFLAQLRSCVEGQDGVHCEYSGPWAPYSVAVPIEETAP